MCIVRKSAVQFTSKQQQINPLKIISWIYNQSRSIMSGLQQQWHGLAGALRPQPNQNGSPRRTRATKQQEEILSYSSLMELKITEDTCPTSFAQLVLPASSSQSVESYFYTTSKHNMSFMSLASSDVLLQHVYLSQLILLQQPA